MAIFKSRLDLIEGYDTKGTRLMNHLLLEQYKDKEVLKKYIGAFVSEMDELFLQIREVDVGRFLSIAVGTQLDIIGDILGQSRNIVVPISTDGRWFGFQNAPEVYKMASESSPLDGGMFLSGGQSGSEIKPLDDETYRRILFLRSMCSSNREFSVDFIYRSITLILGRVPKNMQLRDEGDNVVTLVLDDLYTRDTEVVLIVAMHRWFTPLGVRMDIELTPPTP